MQEAIGKLYSLDAEMSLLGAMLQDRKALDAAFNITKPDFYQPVHQEVYDAILAVRGKGTPVDLVTVDEELEARQTLAGIGGSPYLVQLIQHAPTTANARAYAEIVKGHSQRRKALQLVSSASERITGGLDSLDEIALDVVNGFRAMQESRGAWVEMPDVLIRTNDLIERRMKGEEKRLRIGLKSVDKLFFGLADGEFTVIGARPAVGKSAFAMNLAKQATLDGFKAGFISLEMSPEQYGMRVLAAMSGIELSKIRDGQIADEYDKYVEALKMASGIDVKYAFDLRNIEDICATAQRMVDKTGMNLLVIDYLQLVRSSKNFRSDYERVTYVSQTMKNLALRLNIPVVALAQLSRAPQGRSDKRPVLSDLRDSGAIEQDADNVIMMHRFEDESENGLTPEDIGVMQSLEGEGGQLIQLRVLKQRQGETFATNVAFFPAKMRYASIDRGYGT